MNDGCPAPTPDRSTRSQEAPVAAAARLLGEDEALRARLGEIARR